MCQIETSSTLARTGLEHFAPRRFVYDTIIPTGIQQLETRRGQGTVDSGHLWHALADRGPFEHCSERTTVYNFTGARAEAPNFSRDNGGFARECVRRSVARNAGDRHIYPVVVGSLRFVPRARHVEKNDAWLNLLDWRTAPI